jgi:hypothetical protein
MLWTVFFLMRKDLRKEMLVMSTGIGLLSIMTAYYWWTIDWWHPATTAGARIGIEDFLSGFATGGIMAVAYEIFFRRRHYAMRKKCAHCPGSSTLLILLAFITSFLFWGLGITSFYASTIAMTLLVGILFYFRRDLFLDGVLSGLLMVLISLPVYLFIQAIAPDWVEKTYDFAHLSGVPVFGIPIEEFIFWFLAGLVFGPWYEYWQGERTRKITK